MDEPTLVLRAAPARSHDIGSNVVRLPRRGFEILGIAEGDPVVVECAASVLWVRALRAHGEDEGIDAARLDATELKCPDVLEGRRVRIRVAPIWPALEVEIAMDDADEELSKEKVREALEREPALLSGDRIRLELEGETTDFDVDVGLVGLSLLHVVGRKAEVEGTSVSVLSTVPGGPVRVDADTQVRIRP